MKPINYKALGAKIKEYRKKENITQEQLAEMADISLSHMSNVETASVSVSLPALKLIADGRYFIKSYVKCGDGFSKRFTAST